MLAWTGSSSMLARICMRKVTRRPTFTSLSVSNPATGATGATDISLDGRLRAIDKKANSDNVTVIREYGQNDPIGELDVILGAPRSDTVQAIRETELVRIPTALFDAVSVKHPATTMQFMKLIVGEVRKAVTQHQTEFHQGSHHASGTASELRADRNLSMWHCPPDRASTNSCRNCVHSGI